MPCSCCLGERHRSRAPFFCVAGFCDSISRLCDDPDAFHVFSFRSAGNNSLNWRLTADDSLYTFTEPGPSAFEPDSPTPVMTLTVTVLQTTSDRISTLSVAPVLAAHGCRQSSRLPSLEPAGVRAAQQSLGWRDGGRADRSRRRSAALVRVCSDRLPRVVEAAHACLNPHMSLMTTPSGSGPLCCTP